MIPTARDEKQAWSVQIRSLSGSPATHVRVGVSLAFNVRMPKAIGSFGGLLLMNDVPAAAPRDQIGNAGTPGVTAHHRNR
jgi:hypothetical protein